MGKIFNKGLNQEDKKKGVLKRLKNIEDKNEKLLEVNNKANENMEEVTDFVDQPLIFEAKELINEIKTLKKDVDYRKLKFRGGNNVHYDLNDYKTFKELFRDLYYKQFTIDHAESKQDELNTVSNFLKTYNPRDNRYIGAKTNLVNNASKFYEGRKKIIEGFKNKIFSIYYDEHEGFKEDKDEKDEQEEQEEELKKTTKKTKKKR